MNPDQLLQMIAAMAQQYVQAGGDPAQLQAALDPTAGAAGPPDAGGGMPGGMPPAGGDVQGGPGPDEALAALLGGGGGGQGQDQMPVPDISGMSHEGGIPQGTSIKGASNMALEDLKTRQKRGKGR